MITSYRPDVKGWLQGISDYFLFGIKTLEREYPHEIKVNINTKT
jgi:uncharacterized protein YsxB (DUF464 family)